MMSKDSTGCRYLNYILILYITTIIDLINNIMKKRLLINIIFCLFTLTFFVFPPFAFSQLKVETPVILSSNGSKNVVTHVSKTTTSKVSESVQAKQVVGTVRDSIGILPGVSVIIKGTSHGTNTDKNGNFILDVPDDKSILVFSMIGYLTKEVDISKENYTNVTLQIDEKSLEEVVITGFGAVTKRVDMVGSVTSVNPKDLKVPSSNLTTALAGRVPGMIAYQRSGEPGLDNADFFIRGVATFGYKVDPLILIDNVEVSKTELARMQVDDIAAFSIMKDATATAMYGARGANGVILITTKQGEVGNAKLSFRLENSISSSTRNVDLADPVTFMEMYNEAVLTRVPLGELNPAKTVLYSDEKIANTIEGSNSYIYPANDWRKILFKDYAMNNRANLSVSGGGSVARYYVSGSYNKDNGLLNVDNRNNFNNNIDLKSYTLRSNVMVDITKSTELTVRLSGNFDDYTGPIDGGATMYNKAVRSNPVLFPAYFPADKNHSYLKHIMFGNYDNGGYTNPYADLVKGYKDYSRSLMLAQLELKQDLSFLTEGLSFKTMLNTNRASYFDVRRFYNPYWYTVGGYDRTTEDYFINKIPSSSSTEYLGYQEGPKTINSTFYLESMLNYNREFNGKHSFNSLFVFMMREQLNANAGDLQLSLPFRNIGVSGKATYAYDQRYFTEFTFGYNGSERFHESHRFGFFPSAGFAWSISNEKFFKPYKDFVTSLRLRATYGKVGNDAIGEHKDRFFYLSNVNMNSGDRNAVFGRDQTNSKSGVSVSRYANPDITWEIAEKKNIALEFGILNRLNFQGEYYSEHRSNILMDRSFIPNTMGFSAPIKANVGEASSRGVDLSTDLSHSFSNGMWLQVRGNFTYATNQYEVFEEPEFDEPYRSRLGLSINQRTGFIAERLFVDDEEARNSPRQNYGEYGGGDIKYLDVNRDGEITTADRVPIGNPTVPEIVYGFGFSLGYKNFDFSTFFQGLANESFWIDVNSTSPFQGQTQVLKAYSDSYWSEENRDLNALWPRLSTDINKNNAQASTWFMQDGTFLRLKQIEVGYALPKQLLQRFNVSNFRIYANGTNLLTFSKFKIWDVEMGGNGLGYPIQRVFNIGLNINFN